VQQKGGKLHKKGIDALVTLVAARADLDSVFANQGVIRFLAQMSGGSVRDLMRLLFEAQSLARADDKHRIDQGSAKEAVQRVRVDLERTLWPYHALARIHGSKSLPEPEATDQNQLEQARAFYADLLIKGVVLEYNGGTCWYDVHPIMRDISAFKEALERG